MAEEKIKESPGKGYVKYTYLATRRRISLLPPGGTITNLEFLFIKIM